MKAARAMLADVWFIQVAKTQPIRSTVEQAKQNESRLGAYFSAELFSFRSGWNDRFTLTERHYTRLRSDQRARRRRAVDRGGDRAAAVRGGPASLSAQAGVDGQVPRHPGRPARALATGHRD